MLKWIAAALAGSLCVANAMASEYTFTVIPPQPIAGHPFKIRVTKAFDLCGTALDDLLPSEDLGAGIIRFSVPGSDGCDANLPAQDITYDVPPLPAGAYTFWFAICGFYPVDCHTMEERAVTVLGQANLTRHAIPTLSSLGAVLMAAALLMVGAIWRGRSR